jgi:hypothetical protein
MRIPGKIRYQFKSEIWQYSAPKGSWYFVSLPKETAAEIGENLKWQEEGWGRLKAIAEINRIEWNTAIWYDTKSETYLLPLKNEIRKKNILDVGKSIEVTIWI